MAASRMSPPAVGPLLVLFLCCSSSSLPCPQSCACPRTQLLNCSSSGLSSLPLLTQDSVSELDLSHNLLSSVALRQPHQSLKNVWLGDNSITYLSLCLDRKPKDQYLRRRPRTRSRARCLTWAPALQLLSAERNLLEQLPTGLDGVESLQVLQLSFNRISTLQPGVLSHLRQLKELHLQHNLLIHLHPQMFQNLDQLRVLDLSFNMLTSLHPVTHLTLHSIGMDIRLAGNRWQCDCSMHRLQRRMANDPSRGLQNWNIVCSSPSAISGRDLLQLEEEELNCSNTENTSYLHQDVTVYSGSEILLPCSAQDSIWWTPRGQTSVNQHNADLLIHNISERDTGLYVCVSEEDQVVSVFNLQISKPGEARKPRSLPRTDLSLPQIPLNGKAEKNNTQSAQSDLPLAVSLSVIITFLFAFVLGVLLRPYIDVLWKRITNKKSTSAANSVPTVEQGQYVNEAFSSAEEPEDPGFCRERRVTFSTEESNVQYFDTVVSGDSISSDAVFEDEVVVAELYNQTNGESGTEHLLQRGLEDKQCNDSHSGERRSRSSFSDSSLSGKLSEEEQITKRKHTKPKSPQLVEDSLQQRLNLSSKIEDTQISIEGKSKIPKLSSGSVDDCSPHTDITNPLDSDDLHDNEELFDFSDSAQSPTTGSSNVFDSFNNPKQTRTPSSDQQKMEDTSSSSSYVSENEPTHYTVNSDTETEPDDSNGVQIQRVDPVKYSNDTKRSAERHYSFSSDSSESDRESMQNKRKRTSKEGTTELKAVHHRCRIKDRSDVRAQTPPSDFSSSDESLNEEINYIQKERRTGWTKVQVSQQVNPDSSTQWPLIDLRHIPRITRRLDIKATSPASGEDNTRHMNKQVQEEIYGSSLPIKISPYSAKKSESQWPAETQEGSDTSSSSDSENEMGHINKHEHQELHTTRPPIKVSQTVPKEPKNYWPALNLERVTRIKRRLDIKGPSPSHDSSSSSDSEDETGHINKQEQQELHTTRPPIKVSQTVPKEPKNDWPALNLERVTRIKRRLDIKGPPQSHDSSSSSDSEDETGYLDKREQQNLHTAMHPIKVPQKVTKEPENQWPALNLERVTRIKRRLDIKAPSPSHESSSSSDSEDETGHINKQEQQELHTTRPPIKVSQTVPKEPEHYWPALNLERVTPIKRRLDIKGPPQSHDSSSSSDSEDETGHINKQEQQELHTTRPPIKVSQTEPKEPKNDWPALNLERVTRIKRRLDIKGPPQSHDSSSSSDSEDETGYLDKHEQQNLHTTRPPIKVPQKVTKEPENQWPALNLERVTRIKRRLDIKGPSPSHNSSSSSDSENKTGHINKQEQQELHTTRPPIKVSQTVPKEPKNDWPALNLERVTQIKRRLDIKGPPQSHDSSSSSDSEDETGHINKQEQQELHTTRPPIKVSQTVPKEPKNDWPALNLERVTRIKRRLDIKGPPQSHDSSSSSDSEDETGYLDKHEQQNLHTTMPPIKVPQKVTKEPENQWPALNLERVTRIKRRLDIKGPSPSHDSSSSSDSENETGHINKQEQQELHTTRPPIKVSQTVPKEPKNNWPALNLERVTRIKRRLDIKGPPQSHDSSSSSNSEDETGHINKQEQQELHTTRPPIKVSQTVTKEPEHYWPSLNLERVTRIKRRLVIKGPPVRTDSFSSSDSEDETGHLDKHEQQNLHTTRPPIKVPQTVTKEPESYWPFLNLEKVTPIKRRLDIKGPPPSHDTSSSSDSENDTGHINKQEQQVLHTTRPPIKVFQTVPNEPENRWPALNLERVTRIKRRLDIKGPPQSHDSSSSSDSEDETGHINKHEQQNLQTTRPPIKVPQIVTKEPENQWPALNLEQVTRIKRQLDIKAPSPSHDSSSSSDSEDETSHIKKQEQQHTTRPPIKVSREPENWWPALNLEQVTRIKRRLDIKGPRVKTDSSSSSDSEDETGHINKQEQHTTRPPIKVSQTVTKEPENQWPAIVLERVTRIKRRLDIKGPSPSHDSSSSSDSEDETSHINKLEQQHTTRPSIKVSQTVTKEPENQWPTIVLEQVTRVKRRLDIKGPPVKTDLPFSSDSEVETGHLEKQEHHTRPPINISQNVTKEPGNLWPALNLERVTRIKRRLDIKGPPTTFYSSLSSDNGNKATSQIQEPVQQMLYVSRPPDKVSETMTKESENQWSAIVLKRVTQIKRRLDIKGPPVRTDSSSSSDSEDETGHISKQEQQELHTIRPSIKVSQTVTKEPENLWPALNLERVTRIKRRLDFKGPSLEPDSFSSSDSEATGHFRKKEQKELNVSRPGLETSTVLTTSEKMFTQSPGVLVMNISHTPKKDHNIILEKYEVISDELENQPTNTDCPTPEITPELQTRWATMNLGVSRFRRRLEITSPTTKPPNLPFSPPPDSPYSRQPRLQRRIVGMQELVLTDSSCVPKNIPENRSPTLKDSHHKVSFPFEVKPSVTEEDKTKAETMLIDLSSQDIKGYQDIWVDGNTSAMASQHHSSLSSDSEDETTEPSVPDIKKHLNIKAPSPEPNNTQTFFSQGEKDGTKYNEMQRRQTLAKLDKTDESLITYKRSIIKTSSLPKNSFTPAGSSQAADHTFIAQKVDSYRNTSHSPRLDTSIRFDDKVKGKIRQTSLNTDVALQHEIRWMGVGNRLSGLSTSNPVSMNAVFPSVQQASLTEPHSLSFEASSSTSDKMQDSGKLDKTLMNKYSSLGNESASPPSIGTFDLLGISPASEDKKEKKGLGALKVMSLERRLWEKDLSKDPSLSSGDSGSQDDNFNYSQFEKDTKISPEEPVKPASSSSFEKTRDADLLLLYGIPRYIRHDIKAPVQDTPSVPETPPPDE